VLKLQDERLAADLNLVLVCPGCGLVLQTLDLPCPACSDESVEVPVDAWTVHEYSQTFRARHLVRPRPSKLVREMNTWLAAQPGVVDATLQLHPGFGGEISAATLTCIASSRPTPEVLSVHRIPLSRGAVAWSSSDLGLALNEWADHHPDLIRVRHGVRAQFGVEIDCWLVASGPYALDPGVCDPGRPSSLWSQSLLTLLRVTPWFLLCAAFLAVVAVVGAVVGNGAWAVPTMIAATLFGLSTGSLLLSSWVSGRATKAARKN
jgi:hypothetical protein